MIKKAFLLTLVGILFVGLSACAAPADPPTVDDPGEPAPGVVGDPSIPPLPEDWLQVPNTVLTWYSSDTREDDFTNTRTISQAWEMIGSEADYSDFEQFRNAVQSWYEMMAEEHDDFEESSFGNYTWGDNDVFIDVDIDPDGGWQVLLMITERQPINPDEPMG